MPEAKQFGHQVLMFQPAHAGSGFSEGLPPGVTPTFFKEGFPVAPCAIQGQGREGMTATMTTAKFGLPPGLTPTFFKEGLPVAPCANQGQGREGTMTSTSMEFGLPPGVTPTFFKEGFPVAPCANQGQGREGTTATTTFGDSVPPGLSSSSGLVFTGAASRESTLGRGTTYTALPGGYDGYDDVRRQRASRSLLLFWSSLHWCCVPGIDVGKRYDVHHTAWVQRF